MLKVYSVLFRIVLVLFVVFMFVAQMAVGVAGHNQGWGFAEYLLLAYSVLTFAALWAFAVIASGNAKQVLRYITIVLSGIGTVVLSVFLIMTIVNEGFIAGFVIAGLLVVWISIMLTYSLIKDKPKT